MERKKFNKISRSSPRAWGCFYGVFPQQSLCAVFPTCVGVFLVTYCSSVHSPGLPHVRGGVSTFKVLSKEESESSPRAWGCFPRKGCEVTDRKVFPTCVGVFPNRVTFSAMQVRLPHVRGGVSQHIFEMVGQKRSSPRTWGCFPDTQRQFHRIQVFPTHVGCFCQSFYLMKEPITASNGTPHTLLWILPAS